MKSAGTWRRRLAWTATAWLALTTFQVEQARLLYHLLQRSEPYAEMWFVGLRRAFIWTLLTLLLMWLMDRRHWWPARWPGVVACHALLAILFVVAAASADVAIGVWSGVQTWTLSWPAVVVRLLNANLFNYAAVAVILHGLDYARQGRERAIRTAHLEREIARARFEVLTMQLQPHFLFNTLHAVAAFVHDDPDRAERMILRLGDLLRAAVQDAEQPVVPLSRELALLRAYLDIEEIRFGERLRSEVAIDPGTGDPPVPVLLLQPLVENAIKHGIAKSADGGRVVVTVRRSGDYLVAAVVNSAGDEPAALGGEGLGLRNVRARLAQLYGSAASVDLRVEPDGGVAAVVTLPLDPGSVSDGARDDLGEPTGWSAKRRPGR